jgi:hypothetical protein
VTTDRNLRRRLIAASARPFARRLEVEELQPEEAIGELRTWRKARRLVKAVSRGERSLRSQWAFKRISNAGPALATAVLVESRTGSQSRALATHWALVARRRYSDNLGDSFFVERTAPIFVALNLSETQQAEPGSRAHKALVLAAIEPHFASLLLRVLRDADHASSDAAFELALEMRSKAVAKGCLGELAALCRDTPASLAEIWQLASLLAVRN